MIAIQTVLCPVDFSPATSRQVELAADLSRAFGAKLVLHHNRHSLGTGASVGWMWHADHQPQTQATLEAKLATFAGEVPPGVIVETLVTEGPLSRAVIAVAEAVAADVVVLTAHGTTGDDHVSISEQMLERCSRPVLVLHEPAVEVRTPHFARAANEREIVIVPTNLTPGSRVALQLGFDLARVLPIELQLLHVIPVGLLTRDRGAAADEAPARLEALLPADLAGRVRLQVDFGDPTERILNAADALSASCIIMGEHSRTPLGRWFSRDTSRAILHQARCPVWYVPGTQAA